MPQYKGKSTIQWNYDHLGEGKTLLFIHGWGVDRRIWRQQTKYFSQKWNVLSIDLPGHGDSTWQKISLEEMVRDLDGLIKYLEIDEIITVGSSLGGLFSLKLFELFDEKITKMVFVGSMPKFAKSQNYPYGLDTKKMRKLSSQLTTAYPSIVNVFFRSLFTKEERSSRRFKWMQKFRRTDNVPIKDALAEYLDILEQEDLRDVLKKIDLPLQFINGTHDQICCRGAVKLIKELAPNAQYDDFQNCGHFPFLSKPREFNIVLEKFLNQK